MAYNYYSDVFLHSDVELEKDNPRFDTKKMINVDYINRFIEATHIDGTTPPADALMGKSAQLGQTITYYEYKN